MAREEAVALCHDWMLEFVCHDLWEKVKTGRDLDQQQLDLSFGVLLTQKCRSSEFFKKRETVFLILTSTLVSLKESLTSGEKNPVKQVDFQSILQMVKDLSGLCGSEIDTETTEEAYIKTVEQRILQLCHKDQYSAAEDLFEEVDDQLDRETGRKIRTILGAKNKPHRFLKGNLIENYLSAMMKYLDAVHHTFPDQPLILKHAQYYLTKGAGYNGVRSEYSSNQIDGGADVEGQLSEAEEVKLHCKLHIIRQRTMRNAALANENENNSHDSETEGAAADGTRDCGSHADITKRRRATGSDRGERQTTGHRGSAASPARRPSSQRPVRSPPKHRTSVKGGTASRWHSGATSRSDRGTADRSDRETAGRSDAGAAEESDSMSDVSAGEIYTDEESEEEGNQGNISLGSRVPLKMKPFRMRQSLTLKPPPHSSKLRRKWTYKEEVDFYKAVQRYGVGNWKAIRVGIKSGRTNVHLKDKWRNIAANCYEEFALKYGPVKK